MKKYLQKAHLRGTLLAMGVFLVLAFWLLIQKQGEPYSLHSKESYLEGVVPSTESVVQSLPKETLVLYDGNNETSLRALDQFQQILKDMRMGAEYGVPVPVYTKVAEKLRDTK